MDFDAVFVRLFGEDAYHRYYEALHTSPEALQDAGLSVSFDDLVALWNAGVEAGLASKKD